MFPGEHPIFIDLGFGVCLQPIASSESHGLPAMPSHAAKE